MAVMITQERPDTPAAMELIAELEAHLGQFYPVESRHGYSVDKLIREGVAFFVIRDDDVPAGCGGIQLFGAEYGELKRMYVRPSHRGRGLGKRMVEHLTQYAIEHGVALLRLETGIHQREAISLYERVGFTHIPPFGGYREEPLSRCYEKQIGSITMNQDETTNARVKTTIAPLLSVRRGAKAVAFYKAAFGAEEIFRIGDDDGEVVARLSVDGAEFWVADESPPHKNFSPETLNGATTRIILTVDDPDASFDRAIKAGATVVVPMDNQYGWRLGRVVDPFGHHWEIGKPLKDA